MSCLLPKLMCPKQVYPAIKAQSMVAHWCYFHPGNFCCDIDWVWGDRASEAVRAHVASWNSGGCWGKSGLFLLFFFIDLPICTHIDSQLCQSREHRLPLHTRLHIFTLNFPALLSDFMLKVVEVLDSSQQKTLRGHEAPVLSVTFDPKDDFLVG